MTAWTLILPYPRPPKGLHSNDRVHWRVKARSTAEVRDLVVMLCRSQRIPKMQRVEVGLIWVVGDKYRRDDDGPTPLAKAVYDAIGSDRGTSARIVPDDAPEWMQKVHPRIEYQPGVTAHFRVEITDITHRPDVVDQLSKERL